MRQMLTMALAIGIFLLTQCSPAISDKNAGRERFIDSLLAVMTIDEKIGQLTLFTSGWEVTGPVMKADYLNDIKSGLCGNVFNAQGVKYITELQKAAVEDSRLGIPLLFGFDVIHGFKTIFPIPIAEACSWDPELIEKSARLSAIEATASGINWTYNPMVDIARDPRWGRIAEGAGEDPFLGSIIARAKVRGYQGSHLDSTNTMAACVKHFAAYGAVQAGRDYNTVDMSDRVFREIYLPPFKAAIDEGVCTVMTAFNELDGVPATGNKYLLQDILRNELGFKGMVVTDYTSINELVGHGFAANEKDAAQIAINAGVDMDMQSGAYLRYLKELISGGMVDNKTVDRSVRNVLRLKYDLGLFDDPYRYLDLNREKLIVQSKELYDHALEAAEKSVVLLKNEAFNGRKLLPVQKGRQKIALIGPLGENNIDVLGTWHASGEPENVVTLMEGLQKEFPDATVTYSRGCDIADENRSGFETAVRLARSSDLVIMAIGESYMQTGEAASRTNLDLPGVQNNLVGQITATGKPVIAVVMAGRPLTIGWLQEHIPAILYAWHPGSRTGDAIAEILSGDYNPSAKLVVTFPRNVGQIPIYYSMKNTGRPFNPAEKYTSRYIDSPNEPLYPFGYGLSYTDFSYSDIHLNKKIISYRDTLVVSVTIENTGHYAGEEIVQLYIRDLVGSVTRPVKELKGFKKIQLRPNDFSVVEFRITTDDLRFYDINMNYLAEPGEFNVYVGTNSANLKEASFQLVKNRNQP